MKYALALFSLIIVDFSYSQTDTLYFDPVTGNYVVRYVGITFEGEDTLITFSYDPPTKIDPMIQGFVSLSPDGKYLYRYRITNGMQAQQNLNEFSLHYDSTVWIESRTPETSWRNSAITLQDFSDLDAPKHVSAWVWDGDQGLEATWFIDSCIIISDGLPSITDSYSQAKRHTLVWPADQKDPSNIDIDNELSRLEVYPNANVFRKTIGPKLPPSPFDPIGFLDTIKSYVAQSRSLSWITSQSVASKYGRLIDTARSYLQINIRGVTKAKLDSVLINVHTDSASTLTSEAYALIRFNTEYVLNKLREEDSTFAADNKSSSADATASNSARHLVKAGGYLHEVFVSGGEIFYRRSADEGGTWDQTYRINTAIGENSYPCIATTQHASVEIVWQRRIAPSLYEVWHSYSQDDGASWSTPAILPDAGEVSVSGYQAEGPMPVIAESRHLIAVYCSSHGLRYRVSENEGATWQVPEDDIIDGQFDDRVRWPSLAGGSSYLSLLYDYVNDDEGPYSRIFDGSSWSDEQKVAKGAIGTDGAFSSVAIDGDDNPVAAWSGVANTWTRSVIFRAGYADNSWSNWFVTFGQGQFGPDWVYPSLTYYKRAEGQDAIAIVNHTSSNYVYLNRYVDNGFEAPYWETGTLSESGAWASISQENASSGKPFHCLTDQSSFPYEVVTESSSELSMRGTGKVNSISGVTQKRRAVVYHPSLRSTLTVEFEPLKVVNANGDTSIIRFKASPKLLSRERDSISFSNMWEYLGSGVVNVPANARRLVFTKQFVTRGPSIAKRRFFFRVLDTKGVSIAMLDSAANSGTVSVNITPFAGTTVILRPQVTLGDIDPSSLTVSVGDVYTLPSEQSQTKKKPSR